MVSPFLEAKLAEAVERVLATLRQSTLDRLFASVHEVVLLAAAPAVVAAAGDDLPPVSVDRPEALFDAEAWAELTRGEMAEVLGEIVVNAANGTRAGYAFDVTDPRMAETVLRHVDGIASWGQDLRLSVANTVEAGVREGWSVDRIADELASTGTLSRERGEAIARTEAVSAANGGTVEAWKASGVVAEKEWLATNDDRTRPSHRAASGQRVPLAGLFQVGAGTGEYPGDPRLPIAERVNCRCAVLSVDPEEALEDSDFEKRARVVGRTVELPRDRGLGPMILLDAPRRASFAHDDGPHTTVMVALVPDDPEALVVEGGDPSEELHLTVSFLGEAELFDDDERAEVDEITTRAAAKTGPLTLTVTEATTLGDDGGCVLMMGGAGVHNLHDRIVEDLDKGRLIRPEKRYPTYRPHVTVGYGLDPAGETVQALVGAEVTFSTLEACFAGSCRPHPLDADEEPTVDTPPAPSLTVAVDQVGPWSAPFVALLGRVLAGLPYTASRSWPTPQPSELAVRAIAANGGTLVGGHDRSDESCLIFRGDGWAAVLEADGGHWSLVAAGTDRRVPSRIVAALDAVATVEALDDDEVQMAVWAESPMGGGYARWSTMAVGAWGDVAGNYPPTVADQLTRLATRLPDRADGGLMVFCGAAGTGKTRAVEALMAAWRSEAQLGVVVDSDRLLSSAAYLADVLTAAGDRRQVIVAEDVDDLIADGPKVPAVAKLLNVADGIIGRLAGAGTLLLLTANLPADQLAAHVRRPGRAAAIVEFDPFTAAEAAKWLAARDLPARESDGPLTLADLYSLAAEGAQP